MIVIWLVILILVIGLIAYLIYKHEHKGYKIVIDVTDSRSLKDHFLLDNPNGDGTDPTGGMVDYQYTFSKDSSGNVIPNVNGDTTWQEISLPNKLISDSDNGFILSTSDDLVNGNVGSLRLISRKLFKGGLFIFDVEHAPYGCAVWPALWLNGFIGAKDQYHLSPYDRMYHKSMKKLLRSTTEGYNKSCDIPLDPKAVPDPHLSKIAGKPIYPAMWPEGGEIDVLEETNFSNTNLISIHSGPWCEVGSDYGQNWWKNPPDYKKIGLRSACGQTYSGFGPYSGCKDDDHKIDVGQTTLPNGQTRYNCPSVAAYNAGNTQVVCPPNTFGEAFNQSGGGIYAVQWIPKKRIYIWYWPRNMVDQSPNGPLSNSPDPDSWNIKKTVNGNSIPILLASYNLNEANAMTKGCDFNFQSIVINTTIGGGFGGGSMPTYCSVDNTSNWQNYVTKCYNASPENAIKQGSGVDPANGCYDGSMTDQFRGKNSKPVFFSETYFKIRRIRVFQKDDDDNVW